MSLTIAGLVGLVLTQILGDTVDAQKVADFLEVGGLLIGALVIWYGRWRQGDINFWGKK